MTVAEIAERLQCRIEGDGSVEIRQVASIEAAEPGDLTFASGPKYLARLNTTRASAVIVADSTPCPVGVPAILRARDPTLAFAQAIRLIVSVDPPAAGIHPSSVIGSGAMLGADVSIGPLVTIGDGASVGARSLIFPNVVIGPRARIGEDCVIHSQVSIREAVRIGDRVVIQDGAAIGSDGFGFVRQPDGSHLKIPQLASVVIEDDVEIGANTTIDRPAVGETRIGAGTKIDNLVQIAHGVKVGRRALLAAQVGIAGSTVVEDEVVLAGQVGVAGHLRLGRGVVATAQTGIPNSVGAGELVSGYPAVPNREWLKSSAIIRQLPTLKKRVATLEQRIVELEEKLAQCQTASDA